ncbi:MAG TPA: YgiT-type zinc finger protein [Candidatus Kapabacteria bacterium]|nr:YgiT-type zinc finger protein [Candidatus Kapabacteria bacterium]
MTRCQFCHGEDIREQTVNEELQLNGDIVYAPVTCLVCQTCGERYFDRPTVRLLENLRAELRAGHLPLKQVGKVLMIEPVPESAMRTAV